MLLSSRTEDEVDTKKKQGTLFARIRFQMSLLPSWMLPKGFDPEKDMLGHIIVANPEKDKEPHMFIALSGRSLITNQPVLRKNSGMGDGCCDAAGVTSG